MTSRRLVASAFLFAAVVAVASGCAAGDNSGEVTPGGETQGTAPELGLAWVDDGRQIAVVTWGSSSCVPFVSDVDASADQTIEVTLDDGDADACTDDYVPRAAGIAVPAGVDVTQDIVVNVTYNDQVISGDIAGDAELADSNGNEVGSTPTAGWFSDDALVLLTWGSSSCQPVVADVTAEGNAGTVTFESTEDLVCTMDYAPRYTIVQFPEETGHEDGFELTLVGLGGEEETIVVRG